MNHRKFDPPSETFAAWLKSLKPESELAMRYAMSALDPELGEDPAFNTRLAELTHALKPDAGTFAKIANRAVELEAIASAPWSPDQDGLASLGSVPAPKQAKPRAKKNRL